MVSLIKIPLCISWFSWQASGVHASDMVYLQHSCLPNMQCIETVDEPLFMKVVSLKEIKAGEILTVNKSNCNLMSSTLQRQEVIQASKAILFDGLCACLRCRSPSELNLHCGSLLCKSCRGTTLFKRMYSIELLQMLGKIVF